MKPDCFPTNAVERRSGHAFILATALWSSSAAWALTQSAGDKAAYEQARTEAAQQFKSALAQCGRLPVRDKDVCQATAKAERTKREARAEALYKGTPAAAQAANLAIAEADLQASLRFCDQQAGSTARKCKLEARNQHAQAKAQADRSVRQGQPIDKALGEVGAVHQNDPRACDTLDGGAKHVCLARAATAGASAP